MYTTLSQPKNLSRRQSPVKETMQHRAYDKTESFRTATEVLPFTELNTTNQALPVIHLGRSMCAKAFATSTTKSIVPLQQQQSSDEPSVYTASSESVFDNAAGYHSNKSNVKITGSTIEISAIVQNNGDSKKRDRRVKHPKFKVKWTTQEDQHLQMWVNQFGSNSWNRISKLMPGKSEIKCHIRWLELNNVNNCVTGTWTKDEDRILMKIVTENGPRNWTKVSKSLPGRIGKQCRERWHNHLDPNINKKKWSAEEDASIVRLHLIHGNRWCDIAKEVSGRTDNAIKNRFNSNLSKRLHEEPFVTILDKYSQSLVTPATTAQSSIDQATAEENKVKESQEVSGLLEKFATATGMRKRDIKVTLKLNKGFSQCSSRSECSSNIAIESQDSVSSPRPKFVEQPAQVSDVDQKSEDDSSTKSFKPQILINNVLPCKRTTKDLEESSQGSLTGAESFFGKFKTFTPDRLPNQSNQALQKKMSQLTSLTTMPSLQTSPILSTTQKLRQSVFSGASLNTASSLGLQQPSLLALRHQMLPNRAYCIPDFSKLISREMIELSLKSLLLKSAAI